MQTLSEETWGSAPILCLACNRTLAQKINLHSIINRTSWGSLNNNIYLPDYEFNRLEIKTGEVKRIYKSLQDIRDMWNSLKGFCTIEGDNRLFIFGKLKTSSSRPHTLYCLGIRDLLVTSKNDEPSSIELARAMDSMDQLVPLADTNTNNFDINSFLKRDI